MVSKGGIGVRHWAAALLLGRRLRLLRCLLRGFRLGRGIVNSAPACLPVDICTEAKLVDALLEGFDLLFEIAHIVPRLAPLLRLLTVLLLPLLRLLVPILRLLTVLLLPLRRLLTVPLRLLTVLLLPARGVSMMQIQDV